MAKSAERIQACAMRREGKSVKEIAKALGVSSGSVSLWTRNLELTPEQREYLRVRQIASGHKGRMIGAKTNRQKRLARIKEAEAVSESELPFLSKEGLFFVGLGLYWGEGVKSSSGSLAVSNSDPRVITLMVRWFTECFGVSRDRFMPRIFISDVHRDREQVIIDYWATLLELPRSQFGKTVFLNKGRKVYENRDVYYGVMALRVAKGGNIRYSILAKIDRAAFLSAQQLPT